GRLEIQESDPEEPFATAWNCGIIELRTSVKAVANGAFEGDYTWAKRVLECF
ncbi:hypothetical protein ILYODFUR_033784, partial [Ilyodon furcidens]